MLKIGVIGLGHMGLPMAKCLIKAGYTVLGFDLQSLPLSLLKEAGGHIAQHLSDFHDSDVVITMLQTGQQVQSVCIEGRLFQQLKPQILFIDCSSIDVKSSQAITQIAYQHHLEAVDAPVSGGVAGAEAGTLTFMVGGSVSAFERAKPILQAMGKKIIHAGEAGSGQAAKICNNMILGVTMIAVSEAFILAEQLGLTPQKLFEVVRVASGQCWVMDHYVPVPGLLPHSPANQGYKPGFTAKMMLKDLLLSQQAAADVHVNTPLGQKAMQLYTALHEAGQTEKDFSVIFSFLKAQTLQKSE